MAKGEIEIKRLKSWCYGKKVHFLYTKYIAKIML